MDRPNRLKHIEAEILREKFAAAVADMRATVINTAYSPAISAGKECANGVFTEAGELVATDNPLHMCSLVATVALVLDQFQFDLAGGDVLITNDPYGGGTRVQDFTVVAPLSWEDEIVLYLAVRGRMADVGGELLGGVNPRATELWAEGVRISPVKLYRDGKLAKDVLTTITLNSRAPDAMRLDLDAMVAAVEVGRRRMTEMIERYGRASVLESMNWTIDYAERRFAAEVSHWPAGSCEGVCLLPDDGHSRRNLAVRATLRVGDGRVDVDLGAADPQSNGFVNCTPATAHGFALLPILSAIDESVPKNAGILRRVGLVTTKGTLVDPVFPAPTGWSLHHAGAEVAGAVSEALAAILPERAASVSTSLPLLRTIGRTVRHGGTIEQVSVRDYSAFGQGGCSGAAGRDGWGMPGIFAESPLPSVELYEAAVGDRIVKMELVTDSAGAGRWRGGLGTEAVIVLAADGVDIFLSASPQVGAATGFARGRPGTPNALVLHAGGRDETIEQIVVDTAVPGGTTVTLRLGGGAGWGPPWERSPATILADVLDGYVSVEAARRDYGVVINPRTWTVDETATTAQRKSRSE